MAIDWIYYDIFKYNSDLIIILDLNGKIIDINESVETFFHISKEEVVGKGFCGVFQNNEELLDFYNHQIKFLEDSVEYRPKLVKFNGTVGEGREMWCRIKPVNGSIGKPFIQIVLNDKKKNFKYSNNTQKKLEIINALYNNSPNLVILSKLDGKIMDCNCTIQKIFKIQKKDVLNKKFEDIGVFTSKQLAIINERNERALRGDNLKPIGLKISGITDYCFWIEMYTILIEIDTQLFFEYIICDISNLKATETLLYESQKKFKNLAEAIPEAIYECDLDLNLTYVNTAAISKFGYTEMDIKKGLNCIDLVHPSDIPKANKNNKMLLEGIATKPLEIKMIRKDGLSFYSVIHSRPVVKEGEIKGVTGIIYDITKEIEAAQKIKASEKKYEEIVNLLPEVIFEADLNLNLTYVNSIAFNTFGYTKNDFEGGLSLRDMITEDSMDLAIRNIKSIFNGVITDPCEYRLIRKDKSSFYALVHSRPIYKNGKIMGLRGILSDITERKDMEQALKESESKFRTIAEQSFIGITITLDWRIIYANNEISRMIGYSVDEITSWMQQEFFKLIHPNDMGMLRKNAEDLFNNYDEINNLQFRISTKFGEIIWVEVSTKPITYGDKLALLTIIVDINDKKKAEQNLIESEVKFRSIAEQSIMGIAIIQDFIFKYVNKQFAEIFGHKVEEVLSWNPGEYFKYVHPDDRKFVEEQLKKKQAGEKETVINYIFKAIKKDGSIIWIENYSKTISYQGRLADFVTLIEITTKKKTEEDLKKSEEKYSHLIENISDIIIELDEGLRIEYASPQINLLLGYKPEEILGERIYKFIHIDDVKVFVERLKGFILKKPMFSYEYRFQHKNGIYLHMSTIVNEYYVNGIKHYIFVQRDITRKKHTEDLYQEEIQRLKDLDKLRRDFINRASHELKTPLTSIYGSIQLLYELHKEQITSPEALELLEIAKKGGVRLKNLVFNLLDISRIELKKFNLNKKEHDVLKVLNDCLDEMKYLANKRNLSIRTKFNGLNTLILKFDKIRIEQVFINLLSNAINNTPFNGKINVTIDKLKFHTRFCIEDTGIGLTKEELNKIFKKFSKIERYGKGMDIDTEGTGLGLYISKEIVELHKGKIWASSLGRNHGAKFCFTLPDKDII